MPVFKISIVNYIAVKNHKATPKFPLFKNNRWELPQLHAAYREKFCTLVITLLTSFKGQDVNIKKTTEQIFQIQSFQKGNMINGRWHLHENFSAFLNVRFWIKMKKPFYDRF